MRAGLRNELAPCSYHDGDEYIIASTYLLGCCPAYDEAQSKIASIKSDLQEELKTVCHEHLKGCKPQEAKFVSVKYR